MINRIISVIAACISVGCATQKQQVDYIAPDGPYGQIWINRVLAMEIEYDNSQNCKADLENEIINNPSFRSEVLDTKSLSLLCVKSHTPRTSRDSQGLLTGGLTYQGYIRLATSGRTYSVRFGSKDLCEILKNDLKSRFTHQDLRCP